MPAAVTVTLEVILLSAQLIVVPSSPYLPKHLNLATVNSDGIIQIMDNNSTTDHKNLQVFARHMKSSAKQNLPQPLHFMLGSRSHRTVVTE